MVDKLWQRWGLAFCEWDQWGEFDRENHDISPWVTKAFIRLLLSVY
jgi:hypothetical protein